MTRLVLDTRDGTISVVDAKNYELIESTFLGTSSFPANRYDTAADAKTTRYSLQLLGWTPGTCRGAGDGSDHTETKEK